MQQILLHIKYTRKLHHWTQASLRFLRRTQLQVRVQLLLRCTRRHLRLWHRRCRSLGHSGEGLNSWFCSLLCLLVLLERSLSHRKNNRAIHKRVHPVIDDYCCWLTQPHRNFRNLLLCRRTATGICNAHVCPSPYESALVGCYSERFFSACGSCGSSFAYVLWGLLHQLIVNTIMLL